MAIAKGAVLQQVVAQEDFVQFTGDVAAAHARAYQFQPSLVHLHVGLPKAQVFIRAMVEEQGALQRGVVASDHRETVEAKDFTLADATAGHRVVRAIGVEPGLEPGPGVHQLRIGEAPGNFTDHRLGGMQRHFILRHLLAQRLHHRRTANVGHLRTVADQRLLLSRLDHAHAHARRANVQQLGFGVAGGQLGVVLQVEVVVFDADARGQRQRLLDGNEVVVALPVGVDDVVSADRAPPGLPAIDIGADRDDFVLGDHQRIRAAERAVEEVAVVVDVVIRREDRRFNVLLGHVGPQPGVAGCIFLRRKGRLHLVAIADFQGLGHLHGRGSLSL
ncbi:hypothetical protein D3C80_1130630 [compost metagenome]